MCDFRAGNSKFPCSRMDHFSGGYFFYEIVRHYLANFAYHAQKKSGLSIKHAHRFLSSPTANKFSHKLGPLTPCGIHIVSPLWDYDLTNVNRLIMVMKPDMACISNVVRNTKK